MTSVKDLKPSITTFLYFQTEDELAEHFYGTWLSSGRTGHAYT